MKSSLPDRFAHTTAARRLSGNRHPWHGRDYPGAAAQLQVHQRCRGPVCHSTQCELEWLFVLTVGTVISISNFLKSRHGRDCIAVREDEIAAESIGVRSTRVKTMAFTVGAVFGALAGGIYASYFYFIKPDLFGFMQSINILVIVVLGGLGSISGSIIAAILLALVSTLLQPFPEIRMILYSLALVVLMVFRPQGLMGSRELTSGLLTRLLPGGRTELFRPAAGTRPTYTEESK